MVLQIIQLHPTRVTFGHGDSSCRQAGQAKTEASGANIAIALGGKPVPVARLSVTALLPETPS